MAIYSRPVTNIYAQPLSEPERGFFDKISESFTRGQEGTLARVGVYEALSTSPDDLTGAMSIYGKLRKEQALDPIDGNFLSNLVYKASRTSGQMWESIKRGAVGWAAGKIGGAAVGTGVGLLAGGPSGEEPWLAAIASRYGGKIGLAIGSSSFAYKEGVGGMYMDMLEQGADPDVANTVARYAGIPYAAIEALQIKGLSPAIKSAASKEASKRVLKILGKAAIKYGGRLGAETLEEMSQEIVQISAEEISKSLSGHNINIDATFLADRAKRVLEVGKEAVQSFALLPAPGVAIETGLNITSGELNADIAEAQKLSEDEAQLTPEDVTSPINKIRVALDNSLKTYYEQAEIRKREKGARFAAGEAAIQTTIINTFSDEIYEQSSQQDVSTNQIVGDIQWNYSKQKTISRFPQKVTDQKSLEEVGNAIKKHLGLGDWNITWKFGEAKSRLGSVKRTGPKSATIFIHKVTGRPLYGATKGLASQAGTRVRKEEEAARYSQAELKRTIVHELGHIAKPFYISEAGRAVYHGPEYVAWVNEKVDQLLEKIPVQRVPVAETTVQRIATKKTKQGKEVLLSGEPIKNWRQAYKRELAGEYTKLGIDPLSQVIPLNIYEGLDQELRVTDKIKRIEAVKLGDGLEAMYKEGKIMPPHLIEYARKVWGDPIANTLQEIYDTVGKNPSLINTIEDYMQAPKAIMASMDLSRTLRQDALLLGSPKTWAKAFHTDMKLLVSDEKVAKALEKNAQIELDAMGDLVNKSGIRINKWGESVNFRTGAESFSSKLAKKIPGVQRSERAFSAGGNLIRMNKLKQIAKNREGKVTTDKQWKDIGHVINILTGEGDPRTFKQYGPFLNAAFFAPRLLEARVRAFTDILNPRLSNVARGVLAYHAASFVGFNIGLLGLMAGVPGVSVERDYRSTDFGKIKIGNTRLDFWGGYLPLARLIMRLATGEVKTSGGRIVPVEAKDTIVSFLQSKLGPVPAYAIDLMRGQTFYGDYVGLDATSTIEQFYHRLAPFFIQDLIDAIRYQGWKTGAITAPLGFFGAGVQTYPQGKSTQVLKYKNDLAMNILGKKWDELGPEVQNYIRNEFPDIELKERQAAFDRTNFDFLAKIAKQKAESQDKIYKALPADVRQEFDSLNMKPSGASKNISSDWYLNEERYKQYEQTTMSMYNKILTKLVRSDTWKVTPPELKVQILTKLMDRIKEKIRLQIVADANVSDLKYISRK